ncbi:MAG: hypothetical protein ACK5NL_04660 [Vibrio fluvialis]
MKNAVVIGLALCWCSASVAADMESPQVPGVSQTLAQHQEQQKDGDGVTFVDGESADEKIRRYLMALDLFDIQDESDIELYSFINDKMKWENND